MEELLKEMINGDLYQMILSNPREKEKITKVKIRPVMIKDKLHFQETAYIGNQVFHNNMEKEAVIQKIVRYMETDFKQCDAETKEIKAAILISKKGKITLTKSRMQEAARPQMLSHNRVKTYILEEGIPVPFLIELGVQTAEGKIIRSKYDKYKQINRFLELIQDILPTLPKDRQVQIIDFGCGKSYLTFAIYYYLHILQKRDIHIVGLDLKQDVIETCSLLAKKYGYKELEFLHGDIGTYDASHENTDCKIDMVVTLHACDTATDFALAKAVGWKADVIMSVPCCQHEVNRQIKGTVLEPILKYGLLKERMSALITDAVRANLLEEKGYDVQIVEFIDMEHTPKNMMIRAIRQNENTAKEEREVSVEELTDLLGITTMLQKLLK